jgi:hypothetical protein
VEGSDCQTRNEEASFGSHRRGTRKKACLGRLLERMCGVARKEPMMSGSE